MTTPTTPAAALAEQERVLELLSNADTPESWYYQPGWGLQKHNADGLGLIAGQSDFATHGDLLLLEAAPTLARDHAALLGAYAEALAIAEAARNLYANRLGWSDGRNPYAPRELWDELGRALGADPAGFCDPPDVCRNCNTPVARRSEMFTTEDGDVVCADCAEFDEDDAQAPASAGGE